MWRTIDLSWFSSKPRAHADRAAAVAYAGSDLFRVDDAERVVYIRTPVLL